MAMTAELIYRSISEQAVNLLNPQNMKHCLSRWELLHTSLRCISFKV